MEPRIETLASKKLVGKSQRMSLVNNKTSVLWKRFMPQRNKIQDRIGEAYFSIQIYDDASYFQDFNPAAEFTKCAMVETDSFLNIPEGMERRVLEGGLYAVFIHKGLAKDFPKTAQYIFSQWLPGSIYSLDHREHFEVLGPKYNTINENSEEEVWIPIKLKQPHGN
jgi:AraC family transcriptional regulator